MERPSAARVSTDMGPMGEVVCYDPHFCYLGTGTTARELDPPSAGDSTGLPIGSIIIHPCDVCLSGVYVTIMSERIHYRFSVIQRVILGTLVAICRRHDILYPGILGGCAHLVHHDGHLLGLLWPTI